MKKPALLRRVIRRETTKAVSPVVQPPPINRVARDLKSHVMTCARGRRAVGRGRVVRLEMIFFSTLEYFSIYSSTPLTTVVQVSTSTLLVRNAFSRFAASTTEKSHRAQKRFTGTEKAALHGEFCSFRVLFAFCSGKIFSARLGLGVCPGVWRFSPRKKIFFSRRFVVT